MTDTSRTLRNRAPCRAAILLFALIGAGPLLALDPSSAISQYGLRAWRTEEGLPQSSVEAIAQTPDGYLWFGTQEGLVRFDGVRFTIFDKHNTPELSSQFVGALLAARDGSLWIGCNGGLAHYAKGRFTRYTAREGLYDGFIWSLAEGADGSIWIATYSKGIYRFRDGKFVGYTVDDGLASNSIWKTYVARDGSVWIGTNGGGVSHLENGRFTNLTTREGLANNIVWSVLEDRHGDIWIGTNDGLNRLHGGKVATYTTRDGLGNNSVKALLEDGDGNIWIGTDGGGLSRFSRGAFTSFGPKEGLSSATVVSLFEDREGSLWVGTSSGGVDQLSAGKFVTISASEGVVGNQVWAVREAPDGSLLIATNDGFSHWKNGKITSLTTKDGLSSNVVRSVVADPDGTIWLATADGLDRYRNGKLKVYRTPDGLAHDIIRALIRDRAGNLWIGTRGGGLSRFRDGVFTTFNTANGLPHDAIAGITEDPDGSLWIATNGGLSVFRDGKFTNYTKQDGLSNDTVRVAFRDREGVHWIGTYGGGLNRMKNGRFVPITTANGLFDDVVYSIMEDDNGYFWMTCNRGVFRVRRKELDDFADGKIPAVHSDSFGVADGMRQSECNGGFPASWKGSDGRLYFPTNEGVAIIDSNHIPMNTVAPQVWIEDVLIDGQSHASSEQGLIVEGRLRSLEIRYTALSFTAPNKIAFRYRLRGFSDEWVDAGNRRAAFYTHLPPGTYTFEVKGSNNDGLWGIVRNPLRLRVEARFYQTVWFDVAGLAALVLIVVVFFRVRLRIHQMRERELVERVNQQTAQLLEANAELTAAKDAAEQSAETTIQLSRYKRLILNSAGEGIFGLDAQGVATFINPFAARMLGWSVGELVGRNLHEIIHGPKEKGLEPIDSCVICSPTLQPLTRGGLTVEFRHRSGTIIPVECTSASIAGKDGIASGVVVTFRDVTERLAVERLKNEFVSTVSHELRTPLTAIRGALGLLSSGLLGDLSGRGERMLRIAVDNTDRLSRLINDILDLERIDAGRIELVTRAVPAADLMVEAFDGLQSMTEECGVSIALDHADAIVHVDRDRIVQVMTNLLSNAIKFSPAGTTVTIGGHAGDDGFFTFAIEDEGRGIPEDKLESIFERFNQVDASDSRDKGGTGLGLAICRRIVTAHGGRIWVERRQGNGSVFRFTVPLRQTVDPMWIPESEPTLQEGVRVTVTR